MCLLAMPTWQLVVWLKNPNPFAVYSNTRFFSSFVCPMHHP